MLNTKEKLQHDKESVELEKMQVDLLMMRLLDLYRQIFLSVCSTKLALAILVLDYTVHICC